MLLQESCTQPEVTILHRLRPSFPQKSSKNSQILLHMYFEEEPGPALLFIDSSSFVHSLASPIQFSSVTQLCPTLCDLMNRSTPGLPVHYHLLEFTQTQVHRVSDTIQPSHPLSSPSLLAPNPSQHQSLFQ